MKFKKLLFLASSCIILASFSTGCSKDPVPPELTGQWMANQSSSGFGIEISSDYRNKEEDISLYLTEHEKEITKALGEPAIITIDAAAGTAKFTFSDGSVTSGTFSQSGNNFIIKTPLFLEGLYGESDGITLYIYYEKNYMLNILSSLETGGMDPEKEDFYSKALSQFIGYGGYVRSDSGKL